MRCCKFFTQSLTTSQIDRQLIVFRLTDFEDLLRELPVLPAAILIFLCSRRSVWLARAGVKAAIFTSPEACNEFHRRPFIAAYRYYLYQRKISRYVPVFQPWLARISHQLICKITPSDFSPRCRYDLISAESEGRPGQSRGINLLTLCAGVIGTLFLLTLK